MNSGFNFIVNIPRPYPGTDENKRIIAYIEPLREKKNVMVSDAYLFNLNQFKADQEPSLSVGFKYMFWFTNEENAYEFSKMFNGIIL